MEPLAIDGGPKVRETPVVTSGPRFGDEELAELKEALSQQTLFYWHGEKVKSFRKQFAELYGVGHCHMVTSGTAALHVAAASVGVNPGDEVITSPMTDQGTIIAILARGAVPIFADLDPHTYNITPESIEGCITEKTKAILVVHLAGNAADMDGILRVASQHRLRVIEDCAQSYLCRYKGRLAGTLGDMGCFSLNDFKHISAGDGGMVITDDDGLAARAQLFLDKGYERDGTGRCPPFLAMNYRPSELQGAVAIAQLRKLEGICGKRRELGDRLTQNISDLPWISPHKVLDGCESSYWFYLGRMDPVRLGVSRDRFTEAVAVEGVPVSPGYIGKMVYEYPVLSEHRAYEDCLFPWDGTYGRKVEYGAGLCPVAEEIEATSWRCAISEFMSTQDVDDIAAAIRKVAVYYSQNCVAG
jgi:dTDP-4-amino-4,6-dideoxygalactose transaminase